MKHMKIIILALCILAVGSWAYAQGGAGYGRGNCAQAEGGMNYVDKDGDGVCDNAGTRGKGKGMGQCRRCKLNNTPGNTTTHGPKYVDKDGDGVCDNFRQNQ